MNIRHIIALIVSLVLVSNASTQDLHHYLGPPGDTLNHLSIRQIYPYITFSDKQALLVRDSMIQGRGFSGWWRDKLLYENLIIVAQDRYRMLVDPIFNVYAGQDQISGKTIWGNTRAVQVKGEIDLTQTKENNGQKLYFYSALFESQSEFSPYLDSLTRFRRVVPGELYLGHQGGGHDHGYATGFLQYRPNKIFTFEAGHGKNFIGAGYRSTFLSDASTNYPYFRIDTRIWKIHYVNLWAELQEINYQHHIDDGYQKKYAALHYLSLSLNDRLEVSGFEAINWQGRDSTHLRGFDVNYLNPIILLRPVEWTLGSPDNALLGIGLSYRFGHSTYMYGQLLLDEGKISELMNWKDGWWANKIAYQVGMKSWIPLGRSIAEHHQIAESRKHNSTTFEKHIYLQTEFNAVRPYTYTHYTPKQNYGHFNQALAHPLGANFFEWITVARFRWNRFLIEGQYNWALFGSDTQGSNYGHNIFLPNTTYESEYGNFIGQGLKNRLSYKILTASYLLNRASNLNVFLKLIDRHQITPDKDKHDLIIAFGVRNSIRNLYQDF